MARALASGSSGPGLRPGQGPLYSVLGRDTSLSQCLLHLGNLLLGANPMVD